MKRTVIATALVIGLTTAAAFAAGNSLAKTADDGKVAPHDMAQMNTPANTTVQMPMNGHNMNTMPMAGHDMSKMPMNDRMAMMNKMMGACMTMMNPNGTTTK